MIKLANDIALIAQFLRTYYLSKTWKYQESQRNHQILFLFFRVIHTLKELITN